MINQDGDAISPDEVIDEFRKPQTYKEGADLHKVEM